MPSLPSRLKHCLCPVLALPFAAKTPPRADTLGGGGGKAPAAAAPVAAAAAGGAEQPPAAAATPATKVSCRIAGAGTSQHGLFCCKMARITSDCGTMCSRNIKRP